MLPVGGMGGWQLMHVVHMATFLKFWEEKYVNSGWDWWLAVHVSKFKKFPKILQKQVPVRPLVWEFTTTMSKLKIWASTVWRTF